jgi:hypothetical protein
LFSPFNAEQSVKFSWHNFFLPQIVQEQVQLTRHSFASLIPPPFEAQPIVT